MEKKFFTFCAKTVLFCLVSLTSSSKSSFCEDDVIEPQEVKAFWLSAGEIRILNEHEEKDEELKKQQTEYQRILSDMIDAYGPKALSTPFSIPELSTTGSLTLLHIAVAIQNDTVAYQITKKLLNKGGKKCLEMTDYEGETPFFTAYHARNLQTAALLIDYGAKFRYSEVFNTAFQNNDRIIMQKYLHLDPLKETDIDINQGRAYLIKKIQQYQNKECDFNALLSTFLNVFYSHTETSIKKLLGEISSPSKTTLFDEVIDAGLPELTTLFINFGANPFCRIEGNPKSPLARAIEKGYLSFFKEFLKNEQHKNYNFFGQSIDQNDNTIFHLVVKNYAHYKKADIQWVIDKAPRHLKNKARETPYSLIFNSNDEEMIISFIKKGIPLGKTRYASIEDEIMYHPDSRFRDKNKGFGYFDQEKPTNTKIIKEYLDENATFISPLQKKLESLQGEAKKSNYELPCYINFKAINAEIDQAPQCPLSIKRLISIIKNDPSLLTDNTIAYSVEEPFLKGSLVHEACYHGWLNIIRILEKHGANLGSQDSWGNTLLHIAFKKNHLPLITYLVDKKVPLTQNKSFKSPLFLALEEYLVTRSSDDLTRATRILSAKNKDERAAFLKETVLLLKNKRAPKKPHARISLTTKPRGYLKFLNDGFKQQCLDDEKLRATQLRATLLKTTQLFTSQKRGAV